MSFKNLIFFYSWVIFTFILLNPGCKSKSSSSFIIAGSANMQYALQELCDTFYSIYDIRPQVVLGSSGKLTAQIKEGAPYDLFLSADEKYPKSLYENNLTLDTPETYAFGALILWTMNAQLDLSIDELSKKKFSHIAIPNPETAPYGSSGIDFLNNIGMYEVLKDDLVFGESVAQTNQFVFSGAAAVGISANSTRFSPHLRNKGKFLPIPEDLYQPIRQSAVLTKNKKGVNKWAITFYEFLYSNEAKTILSNNGYTVDGLKE